MLRVLVSVLSQEPTMAKPSNRTLKQKLPLRSFGTPTSRSPAGVDNSFDRWPSYIHKDWADLLLRHYVDSPQPGRLGDHAPFRHSRQADPQRTRVMAGRPRATGPRWARPPTAPSASANTSWPISPTASPTTDPPWATNR